MPLGRTQSNCCHFRSGVIWSLCLLLLATAPRAQEKAAPCSNEAECEGFVRETCEQNGSEYLSHETLGDCINTPEGIRSACCNGQCENGLRPQCYSGTGSVEHLAVDGFDVETLRRIACPQLGRAVPAVPLQVCKSVRIQFDSTIDHAVATAIPRWSITLPTPTFDDIAETWSRRTVATLYHELRELELRGYIGDQTAHGLALMEEMSNACLFGLYFDRQYMEGFASRPGMGALMREDCRSAPIRRVSQWKQRVLFRGRGRFGGPFVCDTDAHDANVSVVRSALERAVHAVRIDDAMESGHHRFRAVTADGATFTLFVQVAVMRGDPVALADELVELDLPARLQDKRPMVLDVCGLIQADGWKEAQSAD